MNKGITGSLVLVLLIGGLLTSTALHLSGIIKIDEMLGVGDDVSINYQCIKTTMNYHMTCPSTASKCEWRNACGNSGTLSPGENTPYITCGRSTYNFCTAGGEGNWELKVYGITFCESGTKRCNLQTDYVEICRTGEKWENYSAECQFGCDTTKTKCFECEGGKCINSVTFVECVGGYYSTTQQMCYKCENGICTSPPECGTLPPNPNSCQYYKCDASTNYVSKLVNKTDYTLCDGENSGCVGGVCKKCSCNGEILTTSQCDLSKMPPKRSITRNACDRTTFTCKNEVNEENCECNSGQRCSLDKQSIEECINYRWATKTICGGTKICQE